jgi:hypothetical protein
MLPRGNERKSTNMINQRIGYLMRKANQRLYQMNGNRGEAIKKMMEGQLRM